jgi:4-amino-4-deoxy-L-arabinose transferase-like glycosyltransferase
MLERLARRPWLQCALVVLVAAAIYLPFLGVRPLDFSEGHRAVPGWTMLESRDFWHQKMFGLTYIRKPPEIAWAIAASSTWLGETTFAARLPSAIAAILMSGIAWWYGRRWLGVARAFQPVNLGAVGKGHGLESPCCAGMIAGLAQALMPLMWSPGRTAEIEMLNNLGTQLLALGLIDVMMVHRDGQGVDEADEPGPFAFLREVGAGMRDTLLPALGLLIAGIAKGPASAMVLGGVLVAGCLVTRSVRPLFRRGVWVAMVFGLGALVVLLLKFQIANDQPDAVREDVAGQFLWSASRLVGVLTLPPLAMLSAMPMGIAVLVSLFVRPASEPQEAHRIARTLSWAWIASVLILLCAGVSNPRYAMPAAVLIPPLVPFAIRTLRGRQGTMAATRKKWSFERLLLLGSPVMWAAVLTMGAWWFVALTALAPSDDQRAGVGAAESLASKAGSGELWADDAIEARPDVLWLMHQASPALHVRWAKPQMRAGELPKPGGYILLRTDPGSNEGSRYQVLTQSTTLIRLGASEIRRYEFTLYKVRDQFRPLPP